MKKLISKDRAKEICSNWHGGQWSAFYQFASSGVFHLPNILEYLRECEDCLHPEYALHPSILSQKDSRELNSLKRFFLFNAEENNVEIVYKVHSIYGYLIPFLSDNTNAEIVQQVKQLTYAI